MTPARNLAEAGRPNDQRYRRLLGLASAALFWEQLWPRLWPAACVLGTFTSLALLDVLHSLPDWLHLSLLLLFAAGVIASLAWAGPGFRKIRREAARTRLERDNDLRDHPLAALDDRLAGGRGDLLAEALWGRHQQRMAALVRRLKVRLPRPGLARHDPLGLRAGVLLMLVIGLVAARQDAGPRLLRAIDPGLGAGGPPPFVELWITPPAYTGVAPMFFTTGGPLAAERGASGASAGAARPDIRVPRGSIALVRAGGVGRAPVLAIDSTHIPFLPLASDIDKKRAWQAETPIGDGNRILVRAGRQTLAEWPIEVIPDSVPVTAFSEPPREEGDGLLSIGYAAEDDYGVAELTAVIETAGDRVRAVGNGSPLRVTLPLTVPGTPSVSGRGLQDLSDQALAGLPVRMYLEAKDVAGQTGRGEAIEMVLPERSFMHPVARAVIALRKRLTDPLERGPVADDLAEIAARPQEFRNDTVVSLALAVAGSRLRLDQNEGALPTVRDLLWQTALRVELGDVPFAERRLEEARQRLMEALQRGAGQREIDKLMDDLQEALDRYLAAAAAELTRRGDIPAPVDRHSRILHSDDLKNLVEMARQLSRTGSREDAMQMLAQLQRALDSIRSGLRSGNASQKFAEAQELMNALRDLADHQQTLLEHSFQQLRESADGPQRGRRDGQGQRQRRGPAPTPRAKESADEQQQLRTQLGELTLRMQGVLGGIPRPLGEADQAMRSAVDALSQGLLGEAVTDQSQAADALTRAIDAAEQAMAQRLGRIMGMSGADGPNGGGSRDIFGRSSNGQRGFGTGPLDIPDHSELQRAHEILEELRRRAAERFRPRPELDYIDRLLRRF